MPETCETTDHTFDYTAGETTCMVCGFTPDQDELNALGNPFRTDD